MNDVALINERIDYLTRILAGVDMVNDRKYYSDLQLRIMRLRGWEFGINCSKASEAFSNFTEAFKNLKKPISDGVSKINRANKLKRK